MLNKGARFTFVEKRSNLYYLKAMITDEVVINNYTIRENQGASSSKYDKDSGSDEDGISKFADRNRDDNDSSGDEEEETNPRLRGWVTIIVAAYHNTIKSNTPSEFD